MIVEILIGLITICVASYAIYWRRERMKWAKIRDEQVKILKRLKEKSKWEK
jgi:hypothetical protein